MGTGCDSNPLWISVRGEHFNWGSGRLKFLGLSWKSQENTVLNCCFLPSENIKSSMCLYNTSLWVSCPAHRKWVPEGCVFEPECFCVPVCLSKHGGGSISIIHPLILNAPLLLCFCFHQQFTFVDSALMTCTPAFYWALHLFCFTLNVLYDNDEAKVPPSPCEMRTGWKPWWICGSGPLFLFYLIFILFSQF